MSSKRPADQAARDRIRTELTRSMLVEAGAGSGKTHEMATRMAAGIASGVYEIEQMAAVTFTRKAAAEMRGRFQLALEQELAETKNDPARETRLRDALGKIERFFAGTIHAFCARLLREGPVEARVAPGFTELDDAEEMMVRRQSWRDYRAQAKAAGNADLLALLDAGIEPKHLESSFDVMCNFEDVEFPPGDAAQPDDRRVWKALEDFWKTLEPMLPPWDAATTCKLQQRADRFRREWRFASGRVRNGAVLAGLLQQWGSQAAVTQNRWPNKNSLVAKQLHADFRESVVLPYVTAWRHYVYRLTVTLLDNARVKAQEDRRRRNTLNFNDLLIITARLLRDNAAVRRSLQQKYRWLFVDEFQDTDPLQAEIMLTLGGVLFVVGDPKQSIYRFRRADIDIYNDVRARLAGPDPSTALGAGGGIVRLTTNFRSVPALCSWANGVFKPLFPKDPTPQSPMFAPLDPHRGPENGPALATITLSADVDAKEAEADAIARYIRAEVDAKRRDYGDFLILTRKKRALQPYARALEKLRVPIEVTGAGAFGESEEVRHLALLLEALADPQDAVALVGVLRGPLFGLSDRDLFGFKQAGGYFGLFAEVAATDPGAKRVAGALAALRQWYGWLRMLPAGAALDRILDASGMLALAATSPDGVEAGDLLHAIDRVRAIVERGFTLADAAEALAGWSGLDDDGAKESNEVDSLPLEPGRPGVVRLMNLHKAKGLEAKVVFLADPKGGFTPGADARIVRTPGGGARGYFRIEKDTGKSYTTTVLAEPKGWETFAADEKAYLDAEVHRLMYVAATRAQDLLVIGRVAGGAGKNAAWPAFDAHLDGVPELPLPATVTLPDAEDVDLSAQAFSVATSAAARAHSAARTPSWTAVAVTAEATAFPRITSDGADDDALSDSTRVVTDDTPSRRADAGVEWGTLVHGLLEHAMRHKTATRADLRRLAMWLTMEEPQLRAVIEQALDTVESVSHADFWPTARASAEAHEEVPFSVRDDRAGIPAVLSGTIDLVYRTDDESWRILDYKTDVDADEAELQRRYAMQLRAYTKAWSSFTSASVTAAVSISRVP